MVETPSTDKLNKLPRWAQEYIAWLREQLSLAESERARLVVDNNKLRQYVKENVE